MKYNLLRKTTPNIINRTRRISFGYNGKTCAWITLSATLCEDLDVKVGDAVVFSIGEDGELYMRKGTVIGGGIHLHRASNYQVGPRFSLKGNASATFNHYIGKHFTERPNEDGWVKVIDFPVSVLNK